VPEKTAYRSGLQGAARDQKSAEQKKQGDRDLAQVVLPLRNAADRIHAEPT